MASAGSARSKCGRWVDVWSHPVVESLLRPADLGAFTLREFTRIRYLSQKKHPKTDVESVSGCKDILILSGD